MPPQIMIRSLKFLEFFQHINIALAGGLEDSYSVNLQNSNEIAIFDFQNSYLEHLAQIEDNISYENRDTYEIQPTYSDTTIKNSFDFKNIAETSLDQSRLEICPNYTYFDLSNNGVDNELDTTLQYNYNYNNTGTVYSVPLNSTPSSDYNNDAIQCFNGRTYRNIMPSQSNEHSESLVENNEISIFSNNLHVNYEIACPLKCFENGVLCLCFSKDKFSQSEREISAEVSPRETQVLPQELIDFIIDGTDNSTVSVLHQTSLHKNINNTSHDDQTKKRKLSKYKLYQNQDTDLDSNPEPKIKKKNITHKLGEIKTTTSQDQQTKIIITNKINNLYYYTSLAKSTEGEKINILYLKNKDHLKYLERNQTFLRILKYKTRRIFEKQIIPTSEEVENMERELSTLILLDQNGSKNIYKANQNFLSGKNFLIKNVKKENFVKPLFVSKNKELKKKNLPTFNQVSAKFFEKSVNFIGKEIELLKNVCNNQKDNKVEGNTTISNFSFKCQNKCLKLIITDIFYFYCKNRFNGDEGCIIKPSLFIKLHEFCELPKFLDLVFLTDYNTITSSINDIIIALNSFRIISKKLYDANFCKSQYIYRSRLHILQYLKLFYDKSTTFAIYSHVMAMHNYIERPKAKNSPLTAILYFSFFTITMEFRSFENLSFFYSQTLNYYFFLNNKGAFKSLLVHLICTKKVNELFMTNFNKYLIKCLCNCGSKINDYKKSYYLFMHPSRMAIIEHNKSNIDNYNYESLNFNTFIHKLINCYSEIIKSNSEA